MIFRLETDVITLRGTEEEASSQLLRGVVVLCLPHALRIEDVHLRMTGLCKVGLVATLPIFDSAQKLTIVIDGLTRR